MILGLGLILALALLGKAAMTTHHYFYGAGYRPWKAPPKRKAKVARHYRTYEQALDEHMKRKKK